jgi:hypothetical protein
MEPVIFNIGSEGWVLEFEEEAIMSGNTVEHVKDAAPILESISIFYASEPSFIEKSGR